MTYTSELETIFGDLKSTLKQIHHDLELELQYIRIFFIGIKRAWRMFRNSSEMCDHYLNERMGKIDLSEYFNSERFSGAMQEITLFFSEARTRSSSLLNKLSQLQSAYRSIWDSMLNEKALKKFYAMVFADVSNSTHDEQELGELVSIFEQMSGLNESYIYGHPSSLYIYMNADFHVTDFSDKMDMLDMTFGDLHKKLDISLAFNNIDAAFLEKTAELKDCLQEFYSESIIDANFYK